MRKKHIGLLVILCPETNHVLIVNFALRGRGFVFLISRKQPAWNYKYTMHIESCKYTMHIEMLFIFYLGTEPILLAQS
jgi:hypothetical protein